MNKAKALLDSLMGPRRDQALNERTGEEFKEDNVCKHYLVGYCPDSIMGKKLAACRTEFDRPSVVSVGCNKLHSVALRTEFQQHKDFEKYQREYEDSLLKHLESIVREADSKAAYEKRKAEDLGIALEFHEKICNICGMKYKLDKKDGMLGSGAGPELYKDDNHQETDLHQLYVKLRARCEEMKKYERLRRDGDRRRSRSKSGKPRRSRSRSGKARRSHSRNGKPRRSPSRGGKQRRSRSKNGKQRRSRSKSRGRERPRRSPSRPKAAAEKRRRASSGSRSPSARAKPAAKKAAAESSDSDAAPAKKAAEDSDSSESKKVVKKSKKKAVVPDSDSSDSDSDSDKPAKKKAVKEKAVVTKQAKSKRKEPSRSTSRPKEEAAKKQAKSQRKESAKARSKSQRKESGRRAKNKKQDSSSSSS